MKIAIDARFLNESGVGRYLRNLIAHLRLIDKKNQYFILLLKKDYEGFKETSNFKKILADFEWYGFAEQFRLPKLLKLYDFDLVHFPHFNVPVFYTGKFVVTIHDLIHQHHNMRNATTLNPFTFKIKQIGYKKVFKTATDRSQKILVPSKSVMGLLMREWKVPKEKIVVTHEAVDEDILKVNKNIRKPECEKILTKFKIRRPYIFYVGNAHPHKNIEGLIKGFRDIREKYQNLTLVLAGYDHFFWRKLKSETPDKDIIFTGFLSDRELVALYKNAAVFVLPSLEEGFGIPVLEAMACSCPVVSSKNGSLPEVGGKACLYFNPLSPEDTAKKISEVLVKNSIRKELIEKGLKRFKLFSWRKLAEQTLEVYSQCG